MWIFLIGSCCASCGWILIFVSVVQRWSVAQSSSEERKVDSISWPELAPGFRQDWSLRLAWGRLHFSVEIGPGGSNRQLCLQTVFWPKRRFSPFGCSSFWVTWQIAVVMSQIFDPHSDDLTSAHFRCSLPSFFGSTVPSIPTLHTFSCTGRMISAQRGTDHSNPNLATGFASSILLQNFSSWSRSYFSKCRSRLGPHHWRFTPTLAFPCLPLVVVAIVTPSTHCSNWPVRPSRQWPSCS